MLLGEALEPPAGANAGVGYQHVQVTRLLHQALSRSLPSEIGDHEAVLARQGARELPEGLRPAAAEDQRGAAVRQRAGDRLPEPPRCPGQQDRLASNLHSKEPSNRRRAGRRSSRSGSDRKVAGNFRFGAEFESVV